MRKAKMKMRVCSRVQSSENMIVMCDVPQLLSPTLYSVQSGSRILRRVRQWSDVQLLFKVPAVTTLTITEKVALMSTF